MQLTEQDKEFLRTLKKKGVGMEEAFSRLDAAKANLLKTESPTVSMVKGMVDKQAPMAELSKTSPTVGMVANQIQGAQQDTAETEAASQKLEDVVTGGRGYSEDNPLKQLSDFGANAAVETGATALEGVGNVVNLLTPQINGYDLGTPLKDLGNLAREGKQTLDDKTDFDTTLGEKGKTVGKVVGTVAPLLTGAGIGMKGGAMLGGKLTKGLTPTLHKVGQFIGGSAGATTGAEAIADGDLPTPGELAVGGVIDAATLGLGKAIKHFWPNLTQAVEVNPKVIKAAERSGLSPLEMNTVKNLPVEKQDLALQLLDQAKKSSTQLTEAGLPVPTPFNVVGDDLTKYQSELSVRLKDVGKKIGDLSKALKGKEIASIDLNSIKPDVENLLDGLNVKVAKGGLDFAGSDIDGLAGDQSLINDIWDFASKKKSVDARDVLSKIRNLNNKLYKGAKNVEITASKKPVETFRQELRKLLNNVDGELGDASRQYAELLDADAMLAKSIQEEGVKAGEFLRRMFGRASGQSQNVIKNVQNIAEKYGIKEGKDLFDKAAIATIVEQVAGVKPPQGLSGQMGNALENLPTSKRDIVNKILNWASSKVFETPSKVEALEQIIKLGDSRAIEKKALLPILNKLPKELSKPLRALLFAEVGED